MKKKGFATSAILYTLLLLFLVLMVGILNNLQNKKTILDALKKDTINALEKNTVTDAILDQIGIINSKIVEIETKISDYEANTYTKTEVDNMLYSIPLKEIIVEKQSDIDETLNTLNRYPNNTCTKELLNVYVANLSFQGGAWIVETCRTNNYATQVATKYAYDSFQPIYHKERSYFVDHWDDWINNNTNNFLVVNSIDEFKTYSVNALQKGMSLWTLNINGAVVGIVAMKADNNYLTLVQFDYFENSRPIQYKYSNGTWSMIDL